MALFWICVFALLGVVLGDASCPTPAELSPCTCDNEGLNCMGPRSIDEIKKAFRAKFKYGGIRSVWILNTPITNLPANLFGNVKSQQFYIEVNSIITVDLKAFRASNKTLNYLSLYGNKIKDFDFNGLGAFEKLGTVNIGGNQIETIPDNAFDSRSLYAILLGYNKISHIGKNAFRNLPSLGRLEMPSNQIKTLGPMSFALTSGSSGLQIVLQSNKISNVSTSAFTGSVPLSISFNYNKLTSLKKDVFENLVTKVASKGGVLEVTGNPFSCQGCDYSWLAANKDVLASKLVGFMCTDRRGITDLTSSNIGCHRS